MLDNLLTFLWGVANVINILKTILFILFISFLSYIQSNTKANLIKYDGIPCQNKTFLLNKPMELVVAGESTMRKGYYHVTKNLLEDLHGDYITVKKTGHIYPKGSRFKVISYYESFDSGPLSGLGGGSVPEYLIKSIETGDLIWISYFEFDTKSCTISNGSDAVDFDIAEHKFDKNITKTIIAL